MIASVFKFPNEELLQGKLAATLEDSRINALLAKAFANSEESLRDIEMRLVELLPSSKMENLFPLMEALKFSALERR